jgi:ribosomal silencing factor RsfS
MPAFKELVKQVKAVKEMEVPQLRDQFEKAEQLIKELAAAGKQSSESYKQAEAIREKVRELLKEHRQQLLQIGAAGRMLMSGELAEVVPLEDEAAHKAANPVKKDGKVVLHVAQIEAREKAMVERLLAADEPVAVIVLGAAHDLADQFEGKRVEYKRIVPSRVEYFLEN